VRHSTGSRQNKGRPGRYFRRKRRGASRYMAGVILRSDMKQCFFLESYIVSVILKANRIHFADRIAQSMMQLCVRALSLFDLCGNCKARPMKCAWRVLVQPAPSSYG
jgi:hypothetical protein